LIKLEVSTHGGEVNIINVSEYNSDDMASKLNDSELYAIAIGDFVFSRIDVKNIKPIVK